MKKIVSLTALILIATSCKAENPYKDGLPKELQFSKTMMKFHQRDFFKELKEKSNNIKSCRGKSCSPKERRKTVEAVWDTHRGMIQDMSWMCDDHVDIQFMNNRDEKVRKTLAKRMKYCEKLNKDFRDYAYKDCLTKLGSFCNKIKEKTKEEKRRSKNLKKIKYLLE